MRPVTHTDGCLKGQADLKAWDEQWPNACRHCDAYGVLTWQESRPWGSDTAMETMTETCACASGLAGEGVVGQCPRCRALQPITDDAFIDGEVACAICGWQWGRNEGDHRPVVECWCPLEDPA